MPKVKVAWVISNIDRWQPFEWVARTLQAKGVSVDYYLLADKRGFFYDFIKGLKLKIEFLRFTSKWNYPRLVYSLFRHFKKQKYDVIHCHFVDASVCGLIASFISKVPKRIYTRHHSTFHHVYAPKGVYIDKFCNYLSTNIIAITNTVKNILVEKEGVSLSKIEIIHHGFDFELMNNINDARIENIANKYDLKDRLVFGVVSRFIEWKGVQYIIPAFQNLLKGYPKAILVLANARGSYSQEINTLLSGLPPESYRLIPFENEVYALFRSFDIFVHTPIDKEAEAFGQIYIESMAMGVPSVFTKSGIGNDILVNGDNCLLVPHQNSNAIFRAIKRLIEDDNLSNHIVQNAKKTVNSSFGIGPICDHLKQLYFN